MLTQNVMVHLQVWRQPINILNLQPFLTSLKLLLLALCVNKFTHINIVLLSYIHSVVLLSVLF